MKIKLPLTSAMRLLSIFLLSLVCIATTFDNAIAQCSITAFNQTTSQAVSAGGKININSVMQFTSASTGTYLWKHCSNGATSTCIYDGFTPAAGNTQSVTYLEDKVGVKMVKLTFNSSNICYFTFNVAPYITGNFNACMYLLQ